LSSAGRSAVRAYETTLILSRDYPAENISANIFQRQSFSYEIG